MSRHFTSNQFPVSGTGGVKTAKKYALFEDKRMIPDTQGLAYPILVAKKKELSSQGLRKLAIKPI